MSRNSSSPAPGGETFRQLRPPSAVRSTVPFEPATHAAFRLTAARPRNRTSVPVSLRLQLGPVPSAPSAEALPDGWAACAGAARAAATAAAQSPTDTIRLVFPMDVMALEASPRAVPRPGCGGRRGFLGGP